MYAIIETGGKQYKVKEGDIISIEKLGVSEGETVSFDNVLAILNDDSSSFGSPFVKGASVKANVIGDGKEKKVIIYKFKAKKGFHKKRGHRQPFTKVKIESITV